MMAHTSSPKTRIGTVVFFCVLICFQVHMSLKVSAQIEVDSGSCWLGDGRACREQGVSFACCDLPGIPSVKVCVDCFSDPQNCGSCGTVCETSCSEGVCSDT